LPGTRYILPFVLLVEFLTPHAFAQEFELSGKDTINRVDETGKKQGKWIVYGKHRPGECFAPDQKVEEGKYSDNKKTGIWIDYHCNGKMKSRFTFVNGRPSGPMKIFHENGKISEEGIWENNRWKGNYKLYYENGQVQHEFTFNEAGRREGNQKYFYENGQTAIEGNFENGKESGVIKEYYENGDLKAEKMYADGAVDDANIKVYQPKKPLKKLSEEVAENAPEIKVSVDEKPNEAAIADGKKAPTVLNGKYTLYNRNKQITKDGIFKDNRFMEGEAYFYNENGILERIAVYRNGLYVGDTPVQD
jgi:antitoxin component YwqK of YwqJK toxin-antitoxin module